MTIKGWVKPEFISKEKLFKGILYILMPKEVIGKRYRITLEPLAGGPPLE